MSLKVPFSTQKKINRKVRRVTLVIITQPVKGRAAYGTLSKWLYDTCRLDAKLMLGGRGTRKMRQPSGYGLIILSIRPIIGGAPPVVFVAGWLGREM